MPKLDSGVHGYHMILIYLIENMIMACSIGGLIVAMLDSDVHRNLWY